MTEQGWRPLGVDTEDEVAEYDALHDAVPDWMAGAFWAWLRSCLTATGSYAWNGSRRQAPFIQNALIQEMCQRLRITMPVVAHRRSDEQAGRQLLDGVLVRLKSHDNPLQIADYLLAHGGHGKPQDLEAILERSKSAWTVGERAGLPGLVRRVPEGVQDSVDDVMTRAGQAGVRLAKAWQELYGLNPDASRAYGLAIKAVEDAAIPLVSPTNGSATLGTVIKQMEDQGDWKLPLDREHGKAPSGETTIAMMRMLWHGQYDRHGGQPLVAGDVSFEEAQVAVGLAVTLVSWFDAKLPARTP